MFFKVESIFQIKFHEKLLHIKTDENGISLEEAGVVSLKLFALSFPTHGVYLRHLWRNHPYSMRHRKTTDSKVTCFKLQLKAEILSTTLQTQSRNRSNLFLLLNCEKVLTQCAKIPEFIPHFNRRKKILILFLFLLIVSQIAL